MRKKLLAYRGIVWRVDHDVLVMIITLKLEDEDEEFLEILEKQRPPRKILVEVLSLFLPLGRDYTR